MQLGPAEPPVLSRCLAQEYQRIFAELAPQEPVPEVQIRFRPAATSMAVARWKGNRVEVRLADVFARAPRQVLRALGYVLFGRLFGFPVARQHRLRYELFLREPGTGQALEQVRRLRTVKRLRPPRGQCFDLEVLFADLNARFFQGRLERPRLGWSLRPVRSWLGHYDPAHRTIVLNCKLDQPGVPREAVEFVLYHEMLHLLFPAARTHSQPLHPAGFKQLESRFPRARELRRLLRDL